MRTDEGRMGRNLVIIRALFAVIFLGLPLLLACAGPSEYIYYIPSAPIGELRHPSMRTGGYFPKSWIFFKSPDTTQMIEVDIHATSTRTGVPVELVIHVQKMYSRDPAFNALPYPENLKAIARDKVMVTADSGSVSIIWESGRKQIIPLSFPEQKDDTFILSGEVEEQADMNIRLDGKAMEQFDLVIPTFTIAGHRLEFPRIHFRPAVGGDN
jgi:hypothetical protein